MAGHWTSLGPPLRPGPDEVRHFERTMTEHSRRIGLPLRALMLGVTPEIAGMNWPSGSEVVAVDRSADMVRGVWPGDRPWRRAVQSDWISGLTAAGPLDAVIGDCSLTSQEYPGEWDRLSRAIAATLPASGLLILRCRILTEPFETPQQVFDDLANNRIASFHSFKLRLAMALQPAPGRGVSLNDVWRCWRRAAISPACLHAITGWSLEVIGTIDLYRGKQARLTFPTLEQALAVLGERFELESVARLGGELRDRHPVFVFRRR